MNNVKKVKGAALAMAAAGLMMIAPIGVVQAEAGATAKVHCYDVNKCKGHNDCKTASNACKGMTSCKGSGFVSMSSKACGDIGGRVGK